MTTVIKATNTGTGYLLIPIDDPLEVLDPAGESLKTLQQGVDGYVEAIDLDDALTMWLNEEGKLLHLPHNPRAQALWDRAFGAGTDITVGPVVLTGGVNEEGDTLPLDAETVAALTAALGGVA
jgi:hypothetical protein